METEITLGNDLYSSRARLEVRSNSQNADREARSLAVVKTSARGIYTSWSRAAYWDGRNRVGERVESGLYFYTLKAGDFSATRKMLIRK